MCVFCLFPFSCVIIDPKDVAQNAKVCLDNLKDADEALFVEMILGIL